jgi:hypothetical protein
MMTQTIACRHCGALIEHLWQLQDHITCGPTPRTPPRPITITWPTLGRPPPEELIAEAEQHSMPLNRHERRMLRKVERQAHRC